MTVQITPPQTIGPPPWSEEEMRQVVLMHYPDVLQALKSHPAYALQRRLDSLASLLGIFNRNADAILEAISQFHQEAENNLLQRSRKNDRQKIEQRIQEGMYVFAAAAMTLVDQSRSISNKVNVPEYGERKDRCFASNPLHRFVQQLRVDLVHVTLHEPGWQRTSGLDEPSKTRFLLQADQLIRLDEYDRLSKQFVLSHPSGVDVGQLVVEYRTMVNEFHLWFRAAVERAEQDALDDYRRVKRIIRSVADRKWWNLIIDQVVIPRNLDPYTYLDRYLTPDELRDVSALPTKSKEQVDRIIELVDEAGACDDDLRRSVYMAFGVEIN